MECKRCGAELETGLAICPECGARQRRQPRLVRCRRCGAKVSAQLVICSSCGRELQPARLWGWGRLASGLVLVVVLALVLSGRLRLDPDAWRQRSAEYLRVAASWLAQAPVAVLPTVILPPTSTPTPSPTATATPPVTDTPIPSPTPTASPSPPPTPPYRTYKVQRGDTPAYIASQFGITAEELMAVNGITNPSALQVGQELIIPHPPTATPTPSPTVPPEPGPAASPAAEPQPTATATAAAESTATPVAVLAAVPSATPVPTATPTASPVAAAEARTYVVQAGDSPDSIARRFGITAQALMAANGITDPTRLRVGQRLVIPPPGATPPPVPTPTPPPATPTPSPTVTPTAALRFPAPVLTNPGDGTPYSGGEMSLIRLEWESVGPLEADEGYVVHVGCVVGEEQTEWIHEQFVQETSWQVEAWLNGRAPQEFGRRYRWYVQVMRVSRDEAGGVLRDDAGRIIGQPLSPESEQRTFIWH
ncbi:MAG: LysM peptidoglycan-binding domain-containing protein [Anaerolineae bacterium]|nr:LysM peptidoglycan-binding domain-containing protein [Anaerolineae bacterium]